MADLAITAAAVKAGAGAVKGQGIAGEAITAGQPVYLDSATQRYKKAQANAAGTDDVAGIATNNSQDGQDMDFVIRGKLTINAVAVVGEVYVLSDLTAGGIAPVGDLLAGDFVTILGVANLTTQIEVNIQVSSIAKP